MGKESVADQIARSLSFEIQAVPQEELLKQDTGSSKKQPVNVKIKVHKKNEAPIQDGFLTIPHANRQVRLISSDQTIMSFDVLMEHDRKFTATKKSRKRIFGMLGPGRCLGTESDDDDYAYLPVAPSADLADTSLTEKVDGDLNENHVLSKSSCDAIERRPKHFFGKCKPGGCLDPPFSEDRYSYKPASEKPKILPLPNLELKSFHINDEKNIDKHSSVFDSKIFRRKVKSINIEQIEKGDHEVKTDSQPVLSLFRPESIRSSNSLNHSNSIITYPSGVSSLDENKGKRVSTDHKNRTSINNQNDVYFIQPKIFPSKQSNKKGALSEIQNGSDSDLDPNNGYDGPKNKEEHIYEPGSQPDDDIHVGVSDHKRLPLPELNIPLKATDIKTYMSYDRDKMGYTKMPTEKNTSLHKEMSENNSLNVHNNPKNEIQKDVSSSKIPLSDDDKILQSTENKDKKSVKPKIIAATAAAASAATAIAAAILATNQEKLTPKESNKISQDVQEQHNNKNNNKSSSLELIIKDKSENSFLHPELMTDKLNFISNYEDKLMPDSGDMIVNENSNLTMENIGPVDRNDLASNSLEINASPRVNNLAMDDSVDLQTTENKSDIMENENKLGPVDRSDLTPSSLEINALPRVNNSPIDGSVDLQTTENQSDLLENEKNIVPVDLIDLAPNSLETNASPHVNNLPLDDYVDLQITENTSDLLENEIALPKNVTKLNDQMTKLDREILNSKENLTQKLEPKVFDNIKVDDIYEKYNLAISPSNNNKNPSKANEQVDESEVVFNNEILDDGPQNNRNAETKNPLIHKHSLELQDTDGDVVSDVMNISKNTLEPKTEYDERKKYTELNNVTSEPDKSINTSDLKVDDRKKDFVQDFLKHTSELKIIASKTDITQVYPTTKAIPNDSDGSVSFNEDLTFSDAIKDTSYISEDAVNINSLQNIDEIDRTETNFYKDIPLSSKKSNEKLHMKNIFAPNVTLKDRSIISSIFEHNMLAKPEKRHEDEGDHQKNSHSDNRIKSNENMKHNLIRAEEDKKISSVLHMNDTPSSSVLSISHYISVEAEEYKPYEIIHNKAHSQHTLQYNLKQMNEQLSETAVFEKTSSDSDSPQTHSDSKHDILNENTPSIVISSIDSTQIDTQLKKPDVPYASQDSGIHLQIEKPIVKEYRGFGKLSNANLPKYYKDNNSEIMPHEPRSSNIAINALKSHGKGNIISVDLGLQSYVNEDNERILKTFDTQNKPAHNTNTTIAVIQSKFKHIEEDIRIPIDTDYDISIQLKKSKTPIQDKHDNNTLTGEGKNVAKTVKHEGLPRTIHVLNKDELNDNKFHDILLTLYEKELVPLQNTLRNLKSEIDILAMNKDILRDKLQRINKSKLSYPNTKKCGCLKRYPF